MDLKPWIAIRERGALLMGTVLQPMIEIRCKKKHRERRERDSSESPSPYFREFSFSGEVENQWLQ
jgi:hypothetical protein